MKFDDIDWEDDDLDPGVIRAYHQRQMDQWIRMNNRKKPRLIRDRGGVYDIVYQHGGKVRVGTARDGMLMSHGIKPRGAMKTTSIATLWQRKPGSVSEYEIDIMQDYLRGECDLPEFDFGDVQNLQP